MQRSCGQEGDWNEVDPCVWAKQRVFVQAFLHFSSWGSVIAYVIAFESDVTCYNEVFSNAKASVMTRDAWLALSN